MIKQLFIILMSNSMLETMTEQHRYRQKWLEEVGRYFEENRKTVQKMSCDRYKGLYEEEEARKENMQEIDMSEEKKIWKTIQKYMSEEENQKKKEYMKEYRKNQSNNVLQEKEEGNEQK